MNIESLILIGLIIFWENEKTLVLMISFFPQCFNEHRLYQGKGSTIGECVMKH